MPAEIVAPVQRACTATRRPALVSAVEMGMIWRFSFGLACLLLAACGVTVLRDLGASSRARLLLVGLLAPNACALAALLAVHCCSLFVGDPFEIPTYLLFAAVGGASPYAVVPALRRLTPLFHDWLPSGNAAAFGWTIVCNATIGATVYSRIASALVNYLPVWSFHE